MEGVVEIYVAGLARHDASDARESGFESPEWLDAHAAPIPPVLLEMLEQVLPHRHLPNLRGVALEVDTKRSAVMVDEVKQWSRRFAPLIQEVRLRGTRRSLQSEWSLCGGYKSPAVSQADRRQLIDDYRRFARVVCGLAVPVDDDW